MPTVLLSLILPVTALCSSPALQPSLQRAALPLRRSKSSITSLAPSGVDGLPLVQQAGVFVGAFAALGVGTFCTARASEAIGIALPVSVTWTVSKLAGVLLGAAFIAAGCAHFALPEAYRAIYPPQGTWGFWYLPGTAEFHVAWTGVAEALGGTGLLLGGGLELIGFDLGGRARPLRQLSATALFLLMLAVSPANIYMYTHGALMVGTGPDGPLNLSFHYARFAVQVLLLTALELVSKAEAQEAARE